ncbi:MAG: S-layer homology domain-containing protein [Clostridia bacterium]|nr:S-layer homology domain-containing protein [Clostridia bacterium]
MKNLKKVLAFVTMFTMLLSVAASAGTLYPDVDDTASYAEAVTTLNALGIMIGDENGNFNPDASITRAETAAIITRMKNLGGAASAAGGTNFTDVAADHWAAGYINLAEQSGIINGYGDGTFGPSNAVTFEQVIKMIVAALGRTPEANNKGGYPSGYLIVASQENITAGVSVTPGAEAPRAAVARLVYNALEVDVMEQVTYKTGEEEYQVIADKTLLKDYLKVNKFEGIVEETYLTAADVDPENDKIDINVVKVNGYAVGTEAAEKYEDLIPLEGFAEGKTNAAALVGKSVSAYAKEDEETGDMTLIGIAEKSGKNKTIVMDESQIESFDGTILKYFVNETDSSATKVEVDPSILVYNNGYDAYDDVLEFIEKAAADENVFGTLTLIDYDNDDVYDTLKLLQANANYVVKAVNATAKSLEDRNGNNIPIDVDDEDVITKIYNAEGAEIALGDIAEGNVITLYNNYNDSLVTAYVSTTTVTGTVTEEIPTSGAYVIGDAEYEIAYVAGMAEEVLNVGDEGTFYVNVEGKIVDKVATSATGTYAYLYKALEMNDINGKSIELKYLTSDGVWETRTLASKVTVNYGRPIDDAGNYTKSIALASIAAGDLGSLINITVTDGVMAASATTDPTARVFQFTTNSEGKIYKLFLAGATANDEVFSKDKSTGDERDYNAGQNKIGSIYLNNETKVFSVPANAEALALADEDDISVSKVSSLFVDGSAYVVDAYDITNNIPALVVAYGAQADMLQGTKLLVISKVSDINNASGTAVQKIYGYQEGTEVNAQTSEDFAAVGRDGETAATLKAGDVVIFSLNANNEIDKAQVLMSVAEAKNIIAGTEGYAAFAAENEADEEGYAVDYFGFVNKKANGLMYLTSTLGGSALVDPADSEEVALPISNVSGVNVYEINTNNSNNTIQILKGVSYIDAETRLGKDSHWAYVRVYDGAIVDIVVYRTTNPEAVVEVEPAAVATPEIEVLNAVATITCATEGATLVVTINGEAAELTEGTVAVSAGDVIEVVASAEGLTDATATHTVTAAEAFVESGDSGSEA